jgi:hypothetical protein
MSDLSNDTKKHITESRETIPLIYQAEQSIFPRFFLLSPKLSPKMHTLQKQTLIDKKYSPNAQE